MKRMIFEVEERAGESDDGWWGLIRVGTGYHRTGNKRQVARLPTFMMSPGTQRGTRVELRKRTGSSLWRLA